MSEASSNYPVATCPSKIKVCRGSVKFYAEEKGFGCITPDGTSKKKKIKIIFRAKHFSRPLEMHRGQLELELAKKFSNKGDPRLPVAGDELVFLMMRTSNGPMAKRWGFADEWEKAYRRMIGRLAPDSILVRVKQFHSRNGILVPNVIWEGEFDKFRMKLDHGFAGRFSEEEIVVEECRATGWLPVPHPSTWHPHCMRQGVA